jgi:ribosomal protein L11 methyltransferase
MYLWRKRATNDWLREQSDALTARYGGALAIVERPGKRTLLEVVSNTRADAVQLQDKFGGTIEKLAPDWLEQFAKRTRPKPLRIGSRLRVARAPGPNTIVIPAEAAFGTGEHATTAMCLRMLERVTRTLPRGWSLLDAGTGSGILAIAGSRLGATRMVAIDNDPLACATAQRNARRNRIRNIEFRTGDVLKQKLRGKFDIVTANLFSELLIAALPAWLPTLAENGRLILSGVLRSQEAALTTALRRHGCRIAETKRRGKWIAVLAVPARKRS